MIEHSADRVEKTLDQLTTVGHSALVALHAGDDTIVLSAGTDALGREADVNTAVPMFCLAKPLVAAAINDAVRDRELSLEDRLGDLINVHETLKHITVLELLEHRSGLTGPRGIEAGLLSRPQRRALLVEPLQTPGHLTGYSEVLGFEALGWCLEEAVGTTIDTIISGPGTWLGRAAAEAVDPNTIWTSEIIGPDGASYPLLFPLSRAAIADPNPGFGGYCQPAAYLDTIDEWLAQRGAPRTGQLVFDEVLGRPVSWTRGLCTSLASELHLGTPGLVGHLGFMSSSCFAFDPDTGGSVFVALSPLTLDVDATRRLLGQLVSAATGSGPR